MFRSALLILILFAEGALAVDAYVVEQGEEQTCAVPGYSIDDFLKSNFKIVPACLDTKNFDRTKIKDNQSQMAYDLNFCHSCLAKDSVTPVGDSFRHVADGLKQNSPRWGSSDEKLKHLRNLVMMNVNGMYFNAFTLSNGDMKDVDFINGYNERRTKTNDIIENYWKENHAELGLDHDSFVKAMTVNQNDQDKYFEDDPDSCVSFPEYLLFNELPQENGFYTYLQGNEKFNPADWDYEKLKVQLAEMAAGDIISPREIYNYPDSTPELYQKKRQMLSLLGRIKFLNSNPLYKNFFSESAGNDEAKKGELYNAIRTSFSKVDVDHCKTAPNACRDQAWKADVAGELKKNTAPLFKNKEALNAILDQATKNYAKMFDSVKRNNYAGNWIVESVNTRCSDPRKNLQECIPDWAKYCARATAINTDQRAREQNKEDFMNLLEAGLADTFSPDKKKNIYYQKFAQESCPGYEAEMKDSCPGGNSVCKASARERYRQNIALKGGKNAEGLSGMIANSPINLPTNSFRQRLRDGLANFNVDAAFTNTPQSSSTGFSSTRQSPSRSPSSVTPLRSSAIDDPMIAPMPTFASSPSASSFSSTISTPDPIDSRLSESRSRVNEIDAEKEMLRSQLQDANAKIAQANENERQIQEERIKYLEQKDSQLSNELNGLRKTIADLEKAKAASAQSTSERLSDTAEQRSMSRASSNSSQNANPIPEISQSITQVPDATRGPANIAAAGGASGTSAAGGQLAGGTSSSNGFASSSVGGTASSNFNQVLLAKYGIRVSGSTEPALIVNQEQDASKLQKLSGQASASEIPLNVSADVYSGFENRNQTIIKKYEKLINDSSVPVVKLMVQSEGKDPLEFYMVKEQGKIVMQPVRKATLAELNRSLEQ